MKEVSQDLASWQLKKVSLCQSRWELAKKNDFCSGIGGKGKRELETLEEVGLFVCECELSKSRSSSWKTIWGFCQLGSKGIQVDDNNTAFISWQVLDFSPLVPLLWTDLSKSRLQSDWGTLSSHCYPFHSGSLGAPPFFLLLNSTERKTEK